MQTPTYDIFLGVLLWSLAMALPLMLIFIPSAEFKAVLLTLVYPNLLVFLSRNGRFWVSKGVIAGASIVAFIISILLRFIPNVKDALDNPTSNQAISATVMTSLIVIFFIVFAAAGHFYGLYNSSTL